MQFFFIVSISMIAGGAAVGLYGRMSAKIHALSERIRKLEESQAKRLPYMSADAIEDLIATLIEQRGLQDELPAGTDRQRAGARPQGAQSQS